MTKSQIPTNSQLPTPNPILFGAWDLLIGAWLEFGIWDLDLSGSFLSTGAADGIDNLSCSGLEPSPQD
jgi:hypothetical protein